MAGADPEMLIARHVERLLSQPQREKVDRVLSLAGLELDDGHISKSGQPVTPADCRAYKRAVQEVYGDATYAFTKVNFVLGGCVCGDCAS